MATYNDILPAETEPDAPLTSYLAKRFVDNPIAMFEGRNGAPRLQLGAFPRVTVGSINKCNNTTVLQTGFALINQGSIRIEFTISISNTTFPGDYELRRRRGGSFSTLLSGTLSAPSDTDNRSIDVGCQPYDFFWLAITNPGSTLAVVNVSSFNLRTGGEDLYPVTDVMMGRMDNNG